MGVSPRRRPFARGLALALRALVFAMVIPFASAGALPVWADLFGFAAPHICHCARDHYDCLCARCHTDPDALDSVRSESLKGRCGDDEVAFGGKTILALAPSLAVLVAPDAHRSASPLSSENAWHHDGAPPPTPPPRSAS